MTDYTYETEELIEEFYKKHGISKVESFSRGSFERIMPLIYEIVCNEGAITSLELSFMLSGKARNLSQIPYNIRHGKNILELKICTITEALERVFGKADEVKVFDSGFCATEGGRFYRLSNNSTVVYAQEDGLCHYIRDNWDVKKELHFKARLKD